MAPIKENGTVLCYSETHLSIMLTSNAGTKRKATEEPSTPSDSKRIKSSNSEEPETNNIPKAPSVIPFPEKVHQPSNS
jgi:histone acetyltransferase